jgi:hypothetical protein
MEYGEMGCGNYGVNSSFSIIFLHLSCWLFILIRFDKKGVEKDDERWRTYEDMREYEGHLGIRHNVGREIVEKGRKRDRCIVFLMTHLGTSSLYVTF